MGAPGAREGRWDAIEREFLGDAYRLLSAASLDPDRRVYANESRCMKVHLEDAVKEHAPRRNDLAREREILERLDGMKGLPKNVEWGSENGFQWMSYDYIPGRSLSALLDRRPGTLRVLRILARIVFLVARLNLRGVCHTDLRATNFVVGDRYGVSILDFDQACCLPRWRCLLVDFLGVGVPPGGSGYQLRRLFQEALRVISPRAISAMIRALRRRRAGDANGKSEEMPHYSGEDPLLQKIDRVWHAAAEANAAMGGGIRVCYYDLEINGHRFPGERSWEKRWKIVSEKIDPRGKRVLELGCNLGMFSIFLRRAGATSCFGVDGNPLIIESAKQLATLLEADVRYEQVEFDSPEDWESRLGTHDLVLATSVINWVKDRERFLRFLGRHRELVFEGHEPTDVEIDRLRRAGFTQIKVLGQSERDRLLLWATR